jgi:hypothetical protein
MISSNKLNIEDKIRDLLDKKGMTITALDRTAKLKPGTVANIIHKRLTNPKIETLIQISEALDCDLYDLIDLKRKQHFVKELHKNTLPYEWNIDLYISSTTAAQKYFTKYNFHPPLAPCLEIILEIYFYSIKNNQSQTDDNFADWIVEKYSRTY